MTTPDSPPFGEADLSNCERELIHLAGSIQPHGVLLVLREPGLVIVQASANTASLLGLDAGLLLGRPLDDLGGDLAAVVRRLAAQADLVEPVLLDAAAEATALQGVLHRHPAGPGLILELQAAEPALADGAALRARIGVALERYGRAANLAVLADAVVQTVRDLTGYDRVMVYKFDPDGHGKIMAEARDPRLESLLGHHYPATDIPQRARELYLRNRVRVLTDVDYAAVPLVPRQLPLTGDELDMSRCHLRSMSPLHLQYLRNMGVTATLVVSLVHQGRLWGLIAAHHYAPYRIPLVIETACELMAEVVSTRIAAIENYAHAQVAILVRGLEQRLLEATSNEGDWRLALLRNPRTLLQPLDASGAALFHDGEVLTTGDVPSTPELRALLQWVADAAEPVFSSSSVGRANAALASLTPLASGVLAVALSSTRPDYLMWFRKEQLTSVTWAGDPTKPVIGNDPRELSPRRSFAAWSEIVRGTSVPWTHTDRLLARAVGAALSDIVVQVHAVRLLVAEHQLARTRAAVQASDQPVVLADEDGRVLHANPAFERLAGRPAQALASLADVAALFGDVARVAAALASASASQPTWRSEQMLVLPDGAHLPVALRVERVLGRGGASLGTMLMLADLSASKETQAARAHFEGALAIASGRSGATLREGDAVMSSILTNASLAAMDIDEASGGPSLAPEIEALELSTRRAAALYEQLRGLLGD